MLILYNVSRLNQPCNRSKLVDLLALPFHASSALCQQQCSDKTPDYHAPSTTGARNFSFLTSFKLWKTFQFLVTFFWREVSVLPSSLVKGPPYFLYPPDVCGFDTLYFSIVPIMDVTLSRRPANKPVFLPISVGWVKGSYVFSHKQILNAPFIMSATVNVVPLKKFFSNLSHGLLS